MSNPLSKAQIATLADGCSQIYECIRLRADGYLLYAGWARFSKHSLNYRLCIYIDGAIEGKWMIGKKDESEIPEQPRKFWRRRVRNMWSQKEIKDFEKSVGKRSAKRHGMYDKYINYSPDFPNAKAFLNRINKTCDSIEVLTAEQYQEAKQCLAEPN